ncbi:MAG: hypothetical protein JWN18_727 [Parcubacteria group bacterium]|nr:hypothetical protein [Parcubacteria group bacterium]
MTSFSFRSLSSRLHSTTQHDPVRDWLYMLAAFAILLVGIIGWDIWMFGRIEAGEMSGEPTAAAVPTFNRAAFDSVHTTIVSRKAEQQKYIDGGYHYSDPSQ